MQELILRSGSVRLRLPQRLVGLFTCLLGCLCVALGPVPSTPSADATGIDRRFAERWHQLATTTLPQTCTDGVQDGQETGFDCGGPVCAGCVTGQACVLNRDCVSGNCASNVCVGTAPPNSTPAPSCTDGQKDGQETGIDCGGPSCPPCALGAPCVLNRDCASGLCSNGMCASSGASTTTTTTAAATTAATTATTATTATGATTTTPTTTTAAPTTVTQTTTTTVKATTVTTTTPVPTTASTSTSTAAPVTTTTTSAAGGCVEVCILLICICL